MSLSVIYSNLLEYLSLFLTSTAVTILLDQYIGVFLYIAQKWGKCIGLQSYLWRIITLMMTACAGRLTPQASVAVHTRHLMKPSEKYFSTKFLSCLNIPAWCIPSLYEKELNTEQKDFDRQLFRSTRQLTVGVQFPLETATESATSELMKTCLTLLTES